MVTMYMGDNTSRMVKDKVKPWGRDGEEKFNRVFSKNIVTEYHVDKYNYGRGGGRHVLIRAHG